MIADEADRSGADDGDDVAGLDVAVEDADLVAGRQDVGQHQDRFVADAGRDRVGRQVGERHADELGLGAVDLVAEDPAATTEALTGVAVAAVLAGPACGDARDEHAVADLDAADAVADGLDGADGLVAEDAAVGHRGHVALEDVQVGAADRGGVDPHDRVGAVDDHRVGDLFPCRRCRGRGTREPSSVTSSFECRESLSLPAHCAPESGRPRGERHDFVTLDRAKAPSGRRRKTVSGLRPRLATRAIPGDEIAPRPLHRPGTGPRD